MVFHEDVRRGDELLEDFAILHPRLRAVAVTVTVGADLIPAFADAGRIMTTMPIAHIYRVTLGMMVISFTVT